MKKIEVLDKKYYDKLKKNKDGDYLIPDDLIIYIDNSAEIKEEKITELEKELADTPEPSNEELIELGKSFYQLQLELDMLKNNK